MLCGPLAVPGSAHAAAPAGLTLPRPTGVFGVGTTELHLVDRDRADPWQPERLRELMVSVFYPTRRGRCERRARYLGPGIASLFAAGAANLLGIQPGQVDWAGLRTNARTGAPAYGRGDRPVVLYSPGFYSERALGTVLIEELASQGYVVVVAIDHTYETRAVEFPGGRVVTGTVNGSDPEAAETAARTRVADARFVLGQLSHAALPPGLHGAMDLSKAGIFGHSAGGLTAAQSMYEDRRFTAAADLDGPLAATWNAEPAPVARHGLDRPLLFMGGMLDAGPHTHLTSPSLREFWARSPGWKLDVHVPAGRHYTFTDVQVFLPQIDRAVGVPATTRERFIGTVDARRVVATQRAYLTAFFDQHLRGIDQPLLRTPSPAHPDVRVIP
uniref:Lipase n=1 Tax=uncultured bacterium esnapd1.2 TaxID=1366589 RepID=S5UBK7_9BACT|nr:lipase [uncultured bacterium esnapd1.2]